MDCFRVLCASYNFEIGRVVLEQCLKFLALTRFQVLAHQMEKNEEKKPTANKNDRANEFPTIVFILHDFILFYSVNVYKYVCFVLHFDGALSFSSLCSVRS